MNKIQYLRKAKNIERLSGTFKLRPYNLLEHQFMVTELFKFFAAEERIDYDLKVLDLVSNHDLLEVETGDLIYTVKNLNERTKDSWNEIENEVMNNHPKLADYSDAAVNIRMNGFQHKLFKACDILDLWIFLNEETVLGNKHPNVKKIIETCENLLFNAYRFESIIQYLTKEQYD